MRKGRAVAGTKDTMAKAEHDGTLAQIPHAYDFRAYAYLQLGQDAKAKSLLEPMAVITKTIGPRVGAAMAQNAVPARYVLERQDWQAAAQLKPVGTGVPAAEAITHFARAVGAARSGAVVAAQTDIDTLKDLRGQLEKANQAYWAGQVEIQVLAAQAWTAQATGNREEALRLMRAAADLEDASEKHVAMENRLYPMRELLPDLLMIHDQPRAALGEYQTSMKNAP